MNHGFAADGTEFLGVRRYLAALLCCAVLGILLPARSPAANSDRVNLFPKLSAGQTLFYRVTYHSDKNTKTQSSLVVAQVPPPVKVDVRALLRLQILGVEVHGQRAVIHARTRFESIEADGQAATQDAGKNAVELTIFPDGRIDQVTGLDMLPLDQQQAWQQWASRFAAAGVFPQSGIRVAQKWRTEEAEKAPSPLARLTWTRESTYVRDEPCRPLRMNAASDFVESDQPPESCAVILTTATLKQQSSPSDATPEDYRVRQLRTSGTARGNNRTITYISLKTGLVVRASDDADQAMSVTVAKADASNRVHYDVIAKSNAAVLLVENAPPNKP